MRGASARRDGVLLPGGGSADAATSCVSARGAGLGGCEGDDGSAGRMLAGRRGPRGGRPFSERKVDAHVPVQRRGGCEARNSGGTLPPPTLRPSDPLCSGVRVLAHHAHP